MKESKYSNKMVKTEKSKEVKKVEEVKVEKKFYILTSPKNNSYTVKADRIEEFKKKLSVDETWTVK